MKNKIFFKRKKMGTCWKNSKVWGKGRKGNETTALPLLGRERGGQDRRGAETGQRGHGKMHPEDKVS